MQLKHNVVLDLYFVYRPRLYSFIWCLGSQFIMIIMVIILLTFERNKEGISNRGKWGCCRKRHLWTCASADGKRVLALQSACIFGLLLKKESKWFAPTPKYVLSLGSLLELNSQRIKNKDFQAPGVLRASTFFCQNCLLRSDRVRFSAGLTPGINRQLLPLSS